MRRLQFTTQAAKSLAKLIKRAPEIARTIAAQTEKLCEDPTPRNSRKIVGYPCHRICVDDYRVICEFNDEFVQSK